MADSDSKSEEEKIQAMLQQSSDQWDEHQDQLGVNSASPQPPMRSPQQFRNPMMAMPTGFNPMMNFTMMNPQLQFQLMMQQQMQMQQTRPTMGGQSNIPPETQKPPVGYVCFKCRQPGHWIYYCPNVPKGQFVPRPGMNGSNNTQRTGGSGISGGSTVQETQKRQKPNELTCRVCGNLMRDAVLVPCCGKSFCKECITKTLDETHKCPVCNKDGLDASQVIPNRSLRSTIQAYKEQHEKEVEAAAAAAAAATAATEERRSSSQPPAGGDNAGDGSEVEDSTMENKPSHDEHREPLKQQYQHQQPRQQQQQQQGGSDHEPRTTPLSKGGMPIQVFESEERAPRSKHKPQDTLIPDTMGPVPFGGNPMMMGAPPGDMSWMMGMPPGLNPAAAAAMMRMNFGGMGDGMGQDFPPEMDMGVPGMPRMPLMNPGFPGGFGGPEEMWTGGMGPMPGMPPPDAMMPFNPMAFNPRGGFGGGSNRGRGGTRGGRIYSNTGPRRRGDYPPGEGEGLTTMTTTPTGSKREREGDDGEAVERAAAVVVDMADPDEAIPTAPRADRERYAQSQGRYRPTSTRSHRRRSRTPSRSRSRSPRRDTHHRRRSPSRSRSRSPKRSSRRRSTSESRSQSAHRSSAAPQDEKAPSSPRSHRDRHSSSRSHRSSRHHSSKYRSRERERDRSGDRSGDRSRRRDRR